MVNKNMSQPLLSVSIISGKDRTFVAYKGRRILVCPRQAFGDIFTDPVPVLNGNVEGVLEIKQHTAIWDRISNGDWRYIHHIVENDNEYRGYSAVMTVGFWITELHLLKLFYPFYYEMRDGSSWRCPVASLHEAWEHSEIIQEVKD